MRVVTAAEMREMDRLTIEEYGIPGVVLMENAGRSVAEVAAGELKNEVAGKKVVVVAGKGNNGGDGFVAARHLKNMGAGVRVHLLADSEAIKGDAEVNLKAWLNMGGDLLFPFREGLERLKADLASADVVIDALYGTGFKGAVRENVVPVVEAVNGAGAPVVAVDIPSGLEADTGMVNGPCIRAACTVTFGLPKVGLVTGLGPEYAGVVHVADISIPREVTRGGQVRVITGEAVGTMLPPRPAAAHKGNFGRALLVGGSPGMTGAICLAAQACARAGAGLVTAAVPRSLHAVAEVKLTEVMTRSLPESEEGFLAPAAAANVRELLQGMDVLALGPGLGAREETVRLVAGLLPEVRVPCIVDADGLNALTRAGFALQRVPGDVIITPHPGEMARLCGCSVAEVQADRLGQARNLAVETGAVVVLKGSGTIVALPDGQAYINTTGNPGLASGGTGDVLTGIIAGLLAQGLAARDAAAAGVYLHGLAGDLAAGERGQIGLLAGDLIEALPRAIKMTRELKPEEEQI